MLVGGRYSVMPNGELHVHRIYNDDGIDDENDDDDDDMKKDRHHHSHKRKKKMMFRCQTKHTLSGMIKLSANYVRLIVTKPQTKMPPKIMANSPGRQKIIANVGQTIELPCVAQAQPWPLFTWYRATPTSNDFQSSHHSLLSSVIAVNRLQRLQVWKFQVPPNDKSIVINDKNELLNGDQYITPYRLSRAGRFVQVDSSLFIRDATVADSGLYVCVANNSLGEDRIEMELVVKAPLSVTMIPSHILASDGDTVTFNCTITGGSPIQQIHWRRNARPLMVAQATTTSARQHPNHRVHLLHQDRMLQIRQVRREDRGMFVSISKNVKQHLIYVYVLFSSNASSAMNLNRFKPVVSWHWLMILQRSSRFSRSRNHCALVNLSRSNVQLREHLCRRLSGRLMVLHWSKMDEFELVITLMATVLSTASST